MPRVYKRKTQRIVDEEQIKRCLRDHFKNKIPIREVARTYNIRRSTIMSRIKNIKKKHKENAYENYDSDDQNIRAFQNKYTTMQVLSVDEENDLAKYIKKCSDLHYGLSYRQIRELACEYAISNSCKCPKSWTENQMAGLDWLYGFMARHKDLSLRRPESTSILRSTGFNKGRVEEFFNNYSKVLQKYQFIGSQIYNIDETGIETVLKPIRVVSEKGKKQVGQVASGERGELVTFVGIINALGNTIPPIYIVPRLRNPSEYIQGAPTGSLILGNKSGWMTKELFVNVIAHIKKHTNCSTQNPILVLLDNHCSHTSFEAIKLCKESGMSILSFPPHTSHRMQPLDIGVFGPFKAALSVAFNDWLLSHPGEVITIRRIGELSNKAYVRTFTMSNIISSFKKPGIWPVDRLAFSDDDFNPSSIINQSKDVCHSETKEGIIEDGVTKDNMTVQKTEKYPHDISNAEKNTNKNKSSIIIYSNILIQPPTSCGEPSPSCSSIAQANKKSFEGIRPYPKAEPKVKKRECSASKSKIYTSTPEMEELRKVYEENKRKNALKLTAKKGRTIKPPVKRSIIEKEDTSDSEEENLVQLIDTDDDSSFEEFPLLESGELVKECDFIIVRFATKLSVVYYIGQVLSVGEMNYEVKFLRRKYNSNTFIFPNTVDISTVERNDIVSILPRVQSTGTARTADLYTFNFNLKGWNIR